MEFMDPKPNSDPSNGEQSDALSKGLGRAVRWAKEGRIADDLLLSACRHDTRHDGQVEEVRSPWFWELIQSVDGVRRLRDAILAELRKPPPEENAGQLIDLAYWFAAGGDMAFASWLRDLVKQRTYPDARWRGEEQVLKLDGTEGLLLAAKLRGRELTQRAADWDDSALVNAAIEHLGEDESLAALSQSQDEDVRRLYELWQREDEREEDSPAEEYTARQVIGARDKGRFPPFRSWGMRASESELNEILRAIWNTDDTASLHRLLQVFTKRALPRFDSRLLDLCEHADERVRNMALHALAVNTHVTVRDYAWKQIESGDHDRRLVDLLVRNYREGDEERLFAKLEPPADEGEFHWILMSLFDVVKHNEHADAIPICLSMYFQTPCSLCRRDAAGLLKSRGLAPAWLLDEIRHDCFAIGRPFSDD